MTIRVDSVWRRTAGGFGWAIKGYEGRGLYVNVATDPAGRGLYVTESMQGPLDQRVLPDDFLVRPDASPALTVQLLEAALVKLGWGPVVRENAIRRFC